MDVAGNAASPLPWPLMSCYVGHQTSRLSPHPGTNRAKIVGEHSKEDCIPAVVDGLQLLYGLSAACSGLQSVRQLEQESRTEDFRRTRITAIVGGSDLAVLPVRNLSWLRIPGNNSWRYS